MNPPLRPLRSLTQTPSTDSSEPVRYHVTTPPDSFWIAPLDTGFPDVVMIANM